MHVSGILFDKDGTLFDFEASWSAWAGHLIEDLSAGESGLATALAARLGFDLDRGRFVPDSLSIAGTVAEQAEAIAPLLPGTDPAALCHRLSQAAAQAEMQPVAGLQQILADLQGRGLVLGVATNDAEAAAYAHLTRAGVLDRFAVVVGFDSGYGAKPDPGMCHAFADAQDLPPERIVMVGDSTHDLVAGRAAGMRTVGVLTGMADRATLAPWADIVLDDISQLATWLDGLGPHSVA